MNTYSVCRGASARLVLIGLIVSMGANVGCDSWVSYTADVKDPAGRPIAGVTSRFEPGRWYGRPIVASVSDAAGCLTESRTVGKGSYEVEFSKSGYKPVTISLATFQTNALRVTLVPLDAVGSSDVRLVAEADVACKGGR